MSDDFDDVIARLGIHMARCSVCGEKEDHKSGWSIMEVLDNGELSWVEDVFCCSPECADRLIAESEVKPHVLTLSSFPNSAFGDLP
jgi:hypothetical protein